VILSRSLFQIRRSARAFARAPGLSFALLLTIALGVGSNAAVYGFLEGLTRPAATLQGTDRVVSILKRDRSGGTVSLTPGDYQKLKSGNTVFSRFGAVRIKPADALIDGHSSIATVAAVTPNIAVALAIPLAKGLVISHRLWQSEFNGSANVVGSHIRVDNVDFRIDGVAPSQLDGLYTDQVVDLWVPLKEQDLEDGGRTRPDLSVLACLRHGVSTGQAQIALRSTSAGLGEVSVTPFTGIAPTMAHGLARIGMFLNFSAGAVFFIACINVASFLLGRALRRSHETSLRIALGATRADLLRELFADSIVISVIGGAMGFLLGILTAHVLPSLLFEADAQRLRFAPHLLPVLTSSMVCIAITVLCGMMPVLGTVTDRPWLALQREAGSPSKAILRLRSGLVIGQIAASCVLVICATLLASGLRTALKTSTGRHLGNAVLLTVQAQPGVSSNYFREVEPSVPSTAGLFPIAWTARLPGNQPTWQTFRIQSPSFRYRDVTMDIAWLTPDSLKLLSDYPVAGKTFGLSEQTRKVAVVDEDAAAEIFGLQTAGVVIQDSERLPIEVIGVVKRKENDAKQQGRPTIYYGYVDQPEAPKPIIDAQFRVPLVPPSAGIELNTNVVSANYFDALDMPLIAGQNFPEHHISGQNRVGVANQEAANLYFDGKPLGSAVIDDNGVRTEIIGVVKSQTIGTFEGHAEPTIYFPMWQDCPSRMTLMLKTLKWNPGLEAQFRRNVQNLPGHSSDLISITTLDAQLAQSDLAGLRISTLIGAMSSATALMLSVLGLLSAQSDAERQRQRERALRIALGSQRWRIVFLVVKSATWLALAGTAIGTFLSFVLLRLMMAGIAIVTSPPLRVWLIAPLLPAAVIVIASMISARRASVISPLTVMRDN
jgi:ABC-type antimicrobial peptide transport system permease subunit